MSIRRNIVANYLGRAYSIGAVYLFTPFYVKILGVEAYGVIAFYSVLLTLTSLADVGLSATFAREAARCPKKEYLLTLLSTIEPVLYAGVGVAATSLFVGADFIAARWFNAAGAIDQNTLVWSMRLMALMLAPQLGASLYLAGLTGLQKQVQGNLLQALFITVRSGLVVLLIFWRPELPLFLGWQLAATLAFAFVMRFALVKAIGFNGFAFGAFDWPTIKPHVTFAGGMLAISVTASINTQLDKLVVSKLFTIDDFAFYSLAGTLAQLPAAAVGPIMAGLLPALTGLITQGRRAEANRLYESCCFLVAALSSVGAFAIIFFAREILSVWLAREAIPEYVVLVARCLAAGGLLLSLASTPYYLGLANGHNRTSMVLNSVVLLISVPSLLFFAGRYHMLGAAIPWVFLNAAALIVLSVVIHRRYHGESLIRWWVYITAIPVLTGGAALLSARLVVDFFGMKPLSACIVTAAFGALALVALVKGSGRSAFRWLPTNSRVDDERDREGGCMSLLKALGRNVSRFLAKSPRLLFRLQGAFLRFGYDVLDLRMANWVIRRPEWLLNRSEKDLLHLEPARPIEEGANGGIAERLIALQRSTLETNDPGLVPADSIWGVLRETHYDSLSTVVKTGDVAGLDRYLGALFRTKAVNGYTYGSTFDSWPHRWNYLPVQIELSVVQLAEALGLIRAECHEQGEVAFWRRLVTEAELIEKLESFFRFRIEQPRFGDPRGVIFGARFLTRETCSHLHSAHKIRLAIERNGLAAPLDIVEIGGGFGGTCYWLRKVLGDRVRRYVIVDLPEVRFVQAFFLGSAHPDQLVLPSESGDRATSPIHLISNNELDKIDFRPNVLINQDSMPEMPESEIVRYLGWANATLDGLFITFNQETLSRGGSEFQVHVPSVVARFPRFKRVSRETSWDRRGYVEEIYKTVA